MFKFLIIASLALATQIVAGEYKYDDDSVLYGEEKVIANYCKDSYNYLKNELKTDHAYNLCAQFFVPAAIMNTGIFHFEMKTTPEDTVEYKTEWYTKACAKIAEYAQHLEEKLIEAKAEISAEHQGEQSIQDFLNTLTGIDKVKCLTVGSVNSGMVACKSFARGAGALALALEEE